MNANEEDGATVKAIHRDFFAFMQNFFRRRRQDLHTLFFENVLTLKIGRGSYVKCVKEKRDQAIAYVQINSPEIYFKENVLHSSTTLKFF